MKNTCILLIAIFTLFSCTERYVQGDPTKELSSVLIGEGSKLHNVPSKKTSCLDSINVKKILELIFSKQYTMLDQYIQPENGIYVLSNPGVFIIATKYTSFKEILKSASWLADKKIDCEIKYETLPEIDCDNGWNKQGCFSDKVDYFNKISTAANYSMKSKKPGVSENDIEKIKNIESTIRMGIILTEEGISFYFSLNNGKLYITVIDLVTKCEA